MPMCVSQVLSFPGRRRRCRRGPQASPASGRGSESARAAGWRYGSGMQLRQCAFPTARQPGFDRAAGIIERIEDGGLIVLAGAAEPVIAHQVLVARMAAAASPVTISRLEPL